MKVGLVGAGAMGSALGANWIAGGAEVCTSVMGRSERTRALVAEAGLDPVDSMEEVVRSDVVVSVVPPVSAPAVAAQIAAAADSTGARPVVADLNAVSPMTLDAIRLELGSLTLVDGSISGGPPRVGRPTRVYLSGPAAAALSELPAPWLDLVILPGGLGAASALKMCTASMYKGSTALVAQAMITARRFGVLDEFLADTARRWPEEVPGWHTEVALAAAKSARFAGEMTEIAATQHAAGVAGALFEGVGATYERLSRTPLARREPESVDGSESVDDVLERLQAAPPAAVLFDFSSTLFYVESAEQALLAALGPNEIHRAAGMRRWGAINGSSTPEVLPPGLADVWRRRDLSADAHRAAYAGLSRHAGLSREQSDALYERGVSPEAWTPYPETLPVLRRLHADGVPIAVVSNIGWDPRPVLAMYGADRYLDTLVLSYEHGVEKPDPAIFGLACEQLGVAPQDAVMVGDNPDADGGAVDAGLGFVLVPADRAERDGDELARAAGLLPQ